jgi:hypothetical protein
VFAQTQMKSINQSLEPVMRWRKGKTVVRVTSVLVWCLTWWLLFGSRVEFARAEMYRALIAAFTARF